MPWLTRIEAAKRVGRSERTIARWEDRGLVKRVLDRYRESELLAVDLRMREKRSHAGERLRQRAAERSRALPKALADELARQVRFADPLGEGRWAVDVEQIGDDPTHLRATMRYETPQTRAARSE